MDRFLRYSLEKGRPIRAMLTLGGKLCQKTVTVLSAEDGRVLLRVGGRTADVPESDILSCAYARGDNGED